jgi:hypothetical protein
MYFILSLIALAAVDSATMDSIMAKYEREGPGVAVAVVSKEEVVYAKGAGYANLDYGIRITPESVFDIGSVYRMYEKEGRMFCKSTMYSFPPIDPYASLKKIDEDTFKYSVMTVRFSRSDGKVNGFWIDSGRANNIWFERQ